MIREVIGIYRLTRVREHLGTSIVVTALGLSIATQITDLDSYRIIVIFLANFLCFTFGFMINDIEDAEDDARDKVKSQRNPVSARILSKSNAYMYTGIVGSISLILFATLGLPVLIIGGTSLSLGVLYSWKRIRLKAWPVLDLVSHALFLGCLEFLAASMVESRIPPLTQIVWLGFSIFMFSLLGDINNELRDYEIDQKSGLLNTAQLFRLKRYEGYVPYLRLLPAATILLYFLLTLHLLNLLFGIIFVLLLGSFYYFHGYRNGRSYLHPLYSGTLQAGLGLLLVSQSVLH